MARNSSRVLLFGLLTVGLLAGCKPKTPSGSAAPPPYFATPFQDESQFIVEAIVSDLAEQMSYAASHRLPARKDFLVTAAERLGSLRDAPVYEVRVKLGPNQREVEESVSINGPIWSPAVYDGLTRALANAVGLTPSKTAPPDDSALLAKLIDGEAETIEDQNQAISAALGEDFLNPVLHEKAAMLLGAFVLRESSGNFYEIRSPLSRITAHLAMARFLRGGAAYDLNGRMAEAALLTLAGDETPALERLKSLGTKDAPVAAMARALWTLNTLDYRPLAEATNRTPVESTAWFGALAYCTSVSAAWEKLSEDQKQTIDYIRIAHAGEYSVQIGHALLEAALPLELQELSAVYKRSHHQELEREAVAEAVNVLPERCFTRDGANVRVCVIGWGQWAGFFQRHLCHAVQQNFRFMNQMWGVPDEARQFAKECDEQFGALRLYPFVRRFNCTDVASYHKSVDDGFKVTVATPHLVPPRCWNELCYKVRFAPLYAPNPNPHVNEWHRHNPPPGTVYDMASRLTQPSLIDRTDKIAFLEKLHELCPHEWNITTFLATHKYRAPLTYEQAVALYGPFLPYSVGAISQVADTVTNQPAEYEKLMLQAAELNPQVYYVLADYVEARHQEKSAAEYLEKACTADPDAVRVASRAPWRVRYYLNQGRTDKARELADQAGEVYSYAGLEAKGIFLEATTNYDDALEWYAKIEERYHRSEPVLNFCLRRLAWTPDQSYVEEVRKRIKLLFPKGMEQVALKDFQGPPTGGVLILAENERLKAAGLKQGDVIVAVYGVRVQNMRQYVYGRQLKPTPELELIVWNGNVYRECKPSLPDHRFGVDIEDYVPTKPKAAK